jgi:hypothetical protein
MNTDSKVSALVAFVGSLSGFKISKEIDGNYNHMGATIADAVLQANMKYESHVRPRINKIRQQHPQATTLSGLIQLLSEVPTTTFLDWRGVDRANRFNEVVELLSREGIDSEEEFKAWLSSDSNLLLLQEIRGIGPKTADYFRILTGFQTNAIDRHLLNFLKKAGIKATGYAEAQTVINLAADEMGIARAHFDHSIWTYMTKNRIQRKSKCHDASNKCIETDAE